MQIEVHKTVAARPPAVFKTVTDIMNWPRIIGSVTAIELLTRGRVRVGTRVRLIRIMYGRQMTEELEVETFERPRGLRLVETERGPGPLKNFITPFMRTCRSTCATNWSATSSIWPPLNRLPNCME